MNSKTKNSLIIIGTLLIGIIIGFLVSGRFTAVRMDNMRTNFTDQGMYRHIFQAINPDAKQMKDIKPIFDKYSEIRKNQLYDHYENQRLMFKDFELELTPYLNQNQIERLHRMKNNFREKFPDFKQRKMNQGRGQGRQQGRGSNRGRSN